MSFLKVENVSRHFGNLVAVDGVSMTVEPGECRAVIGPNGAGKTTFFNLITGMLGLTTGRVLLEDKDLAGIDPTHRVKLGMARTFQITEIFPELTVSENIRIPVETAAGLSMKARMSASQRSGVRQRIDQLLEEGGLSRIAHRYAGELSHGDQRATEIMMALALNPRLLLLDEPTAGMGDDETHAVARLIKRIHRESRMTIVLIEHDMRVVFNLADKITVLAEGRPLAEGTPAEITANAKVQAAYLGGAA
ncbi:ABC transporter ATP-binding protein [Solirhodobacter olei]|uniref:ABC transporter ATP-binding protein n=1 Tax=Solirhodobacter olei TaxID=2493082 RepID=UPI000FD97983|nr:ABC transporter ATP-binding protein [Solirhodobacter olei]